MLSGDPAVASPPSKLRTGAVCIMRERLGAAVGREVLGLGSSSILNSGKIYLIINFSENSAIKAAVIAATISIIGLCQSSGLVIKNAKNNPTNTSKKL